MTNINIKQKFNRYSDLFHKSVPYFEIEIPKTTVIKGITIHTMNRYDVPRNQVHNKQFYFPAISDLDPNYNTKQINKAYCKKQGLLDYKDIQDILNKYKLSIRQFANVLGISPASLCNMKNGKVLPSKLVSNMLKLLSNKNNMKYLIDNHKKYITMVK